MEIIDFGIAEVKEKIVAIVKFGPFTKADGMRPAEYYQVTIDPSKVSPSGKFIRFGTTQGDEIVGWQRTEAIAIVEVLGKWDDETPPLLKYGADEPVKFMALPEFEKV